MNQFSPKSREIARRIFSAGIYYPDILVSGEGLFEVQGKFYINVFPESRTFGIGGNQIEDGMYDARRQF